jgi:hypothetical protein
MIFCLLWIRIPMVRINESNMIDTQGAMIVTRLILEDDCEEELDPDADFDTLVRFETGTPSEDRNSDGMDEDDEFDMSLSMT